MTPEQFLRQIEKQPPQPAYLFVGPESYARSRCWEALEARVLSPGEREAGITRHDLDEVPLVQVLDDARSLSLFSTARLIRVSAAESALPRRLGAADAAESSALAEYLEHPSPGTVLVFDAQRYEFEGDDKARLERVRKFYAPIAAQVEFRPYSEDAARALARDLAARAGLAIAPAAIGLLVASLGADARRIETEIEKLSLFAGDGGRIGLPEIAALVPQAHTATVFALVGALGRSDRRKSLEALDTLLKEGEYMPLALAFLGTQFRLALAAREAGLRTPNEIQSYFTRAGVRMWRARAEEVAGTVAAFSGERLERAIGRLYAADKALRDARPDDRVVMEEFVLALTG